MFISLTEIPHRRVPVSVFTIERRLWHEVARDVIVLAALDVANAAIGCIQVVIVAIAITVQQAARELAVLWRHWHVTVVSGSVVVTSWFLAIPKQIIIAQHRLIVTQNTIAATLKTALGPPNAGKVTGHRQVVVTRIILGALTDNYFVPEEACQLGGTGLFVDNSCQK